MNSIVRCILLVGCRMPCRRFTFQPSVLGRFLGVPAPELATHNFDAKVVLGAAARQLNERLANAGSYAELQVLAEAFLWRRIQATMPACCPSIT